MEIFHGWRETKSRIASDSSHANEEKEMYIYLSEFSMFEFTFWCFFSIICKYSF